MRWVLATCISRLTFWPYSLFCSSWVWPFPWHCFIRSTEQGRSTMPSQTPVQTEAYGTDSGRNAPLHPLQLLTLSPVLPKLLCTDISHASLFFFFLFSLLTPLICQRERETERKEFKLFGQEAPYWLCPFPYSFRTFFCMLGLTNNCRKENIMTTINCIALLMYNSHPARKGEDIED